MLRKVILFCRFCYTSDLLAVLSFLCSLKFTFEAVKSLTTGSSFEEFLNVTLTAEYEESLKQTVQSPQPDPAVTTEGLTDFNLEEDTYVGDL